MYALLYKEIGLDNWESVAVNVMLSTSPSYQLFFNHVVHLVVASHSSVGKNKFLKFFLKIHIRKWKVFAVWIRAFSELNSEHIIYNLQVDMFTMWDKLLYMTNTTEFMLLGKKKLCVNFFMVCVNFTFANNKFIFHCTHMYVIYKANLLI